MNEIYVNKNKKNRRKKFLFFMYINNEKSLIQNQ